MNQHRVLLIIASMVTASLTLWICLPIATVVAGAFWDIPWLGTPSEQWAAAHEADALRWIAYVWNLYGDSLLFSLRLALCCVALSGGIAFGAAFALARYPSRWGRLIESAALLPLALPGISLSIAIIQVYAIWRGYWQLILAGHLLYAVPFFLKALTHHLRSLNIAMLDQAAASLGAGATQRLLWVALPNMRRGIVLGGLLVFAVSWGEFNISFLLNTPLYQTYPAALYATYTSNSFAVAGAATVLFLIVIAPIQFCMQYLADDRAYVVHQGV